MNFVSDDRFSWARPWLRSRSFRFFLFIASIYLVVNFLAERHQRDFILDKAPDALAKLPIKAWDANSFFSRGDPWGVMLFDMDEETLQAVRAYDVSYLQKRFYGTWSRLPYPASSFSEGAPPPVAYAHGLGSVGVGDLLRIMKGSDGLYSCGSGVSLFVNAEAGYIAMLYHG